VAADAIAVDKLRDLFLQLLRPETLRSTRAGPHGRCHHPPHGGPAAGPGARWNGAGLAKEPMQAGEVNAATRGKGGRRVGCCATALWSSTKTWLIAENRDFEVHGTAKNSSDRDGTRTTETTGASQPPGGSPSPCEELARRARPNSTLETRLTEGRKKGATRCLGGGTVDAERLNRYERKAVRFESGTRVTLHRLEGWCRMH